MLDAATVNCAVPVLQLFTLTGCVEMIGVGVTVNKAVFEILVQELFEATMRYK